MPYCGSRGRHLARRCRKVTCHEGAGAIPPWRRRYRDPRWRHLASSCAAVADLWIPGEAAAWLRDHSQHGGRRGWCGLQSRRSRRDGDRGPHAGLDPPAHHRPRRGGHRVLWAQCSGPGLPRELTGGGLAARSRHGGGLSAGSRHRGELAARSRQCGEVTGACGELAARSRQGGELTGADR